MIVYHTKRHCGGGEVTQWEKGKLTLAEAVSRKPLKTLEDSSRQRRKLTGHFVSILQQAEKEADWSHCIYTQEVKAEEKVKLGYKARGPH